MVASRRIRWPAFLAAAPAGGAGTPSAGRSRAREGLNLVRLTPNQVQPMSEPDSPSGEPDSRTRGGPKLFNLVKERTRLSSPRRVPVLAHQGVELLPRERPPALRLAGLPIDRAAADLYHAQPFPLTPPH